MEFTRRATLLPVLAAALAAAACGSSENPEAPEAAPAPKAAPAAAAKADNAPPTIRQVRLEPEDPAPGGSVRAVVEADDPNGDRLHFQYEWRIADQPAGTKQSVSLSAATRGQTVEVSVTASDGANTSAPERAWVELRNRAPEVRRVTVEPPSEVTIGTPVQAVAEGLDRDGDAVEFRYVWTVNGSERRGNGATLTTDRLRRGDEIGLRVVASDGDEESEPMEAPVITIVNTPPVVTSTPPTALEDGVFVYQLTVEDPDDRRGHEYRLDEHPEGMRIDKRRGLIRWEPRLDQAGVHAVTAIVTDRQDGEGRHEFGVSISAPDEAPAAAAP